MKSHSVHWPTGLEPNSHEKDETLKMSDHDSLTCFSQHAEQSGRNVEKMYSVTHRRCFRRHGCPCKDLWSWPHCHEKCDCHTVASRTWSGLSQSADCQLVRSRVSSGLHSFQAEDEDEVVQVQDEYFHLVEFHSSSLFFKVFCLLDSSILSSLTFNFAGDLAR